MDDDYTLFFFLSLLPPCLLYQSLIFHRILLDGLSSQPLVHVSGLVALLVFFFCLVFGRKKWASDQKNPGGCDEMKPKTDGRLCLGPGMAHHDLRATSPGGRPGL